MFKFALLVIVAFVSFDYGVTQGYRPNYQDQNYGPPMPYSFQSNTVDEYGTQLTRSEQKDASGTVTGSYSYRDADGLYRIVDYVADANGFRANVRTNEPGTAKDHSGDPADTQWVIEPPPANVVQKWAGRSSWQPGAAPSGRRYAPLLRNDVGYIGDYNYDYNRYPRAPPRPKA